MYKCINCSFEGEELSKKSYGKMYDGKCPICGDEVIAIYVENKLSKIEPEKGASNKFDFNNDGIVDSKDASLAAKLLGSKKAKRGARK